MDPGTHNVGGWRVELFGWLRAVHADRTITRFSTRKTAALLAYLAFYRQRAHGRSELISCIWPDCAPEAGRRSLRVALSSLRHQLEPPGVIPGSVLRSDGDAVQLSPAACDTDVAQFEAAVQAAMRARQSPERVQRLEAAVALYRGELLPGCLEEWILPEQQRLGELFFQVLSELIHGLEEQKGVGRALQYALRAVAADPLREEAHREAIRLLSAAGRPEAALRHYEMLERMLPGIDCSAPPAAARLVVLTPRSRPGGSGKERGTRDEAPLLVPAPSGPLARPFQADGSSALPPPPGTGPGCPPMDLPRATAGHLPLRLTRFFGREAEIARVQELLSESGDARYPLGVCGKTADGSRDRSSPPGCHSPSTAGRLITLTGPAGSGKTRLAIEAADRLRHRFQAAVWFAPLAELNSANQIPEKLQEVLCLPRSPEREPLQQVAAFLSQQPSWLVLDNFEHLGAEAAALVHSLLEKAPTLTCLVTSRQRLNLAEEQELAIGPLPVPVESGTLRVESPTKTDRADRTDQSDLSTLNSQLSTVADCPSVQLFIDRARAVRPDFQVTPGNAPAVARLCRRLEGLPLALELAAARAGVLSPAQILARLDHRFELLTSRQSDADTRHRSLRATLDWSYRLLSPELQRFFAGLSIFRGGWTLEAAAAVCDTAAQVYLGRLEESSLALVEQQPAPAAGWVRVLIPQTRFLLLETVREYAAEQLGPEQRTELARRHAHFFLALAEQAEPELQGPAQGEWLTRLEQEHDNLRAALAWAIAVRETSIGLRLAGVLGLFWQTRGYWTEGREWLARLLALDDSAGRGPSAHRARALVQAARLADNQGDLESAWTLAQESLAIGRMIADDPVIANSLQMLGWLSTRQGNDPAARHLYEEGLTTAHRCGNLPVVASLLFFLANLLNSQNDEPMARSLCHECLEIRRQLGDRCGMTEVLGSLARMAYLNGDYAAARSLLEESLAIRRELSDRPGIALALLSLGEVLRCQREYAAAEPLYEESLALYRELGDRGSVGGLLGNLGYVWLNRGDHRRAVDFFVEGLVLFRDLASQMEHVPAVLGFFIRGGALCLGGLAAVFGAAGRPEQAARWFGTAEALREAVQCGMWPADRADHERFVAAVRAALDEATFSAAWSAGRAMPPDEIVTAALREVAEL